MRCIVDTTALALDIANYLHTEGLVRSPMADQYVDDELPAVFVGPLEDQPDRAVGIIGPWLDSTDSDTNPLVRFMVVTRTTEHDFMQLAEDSENLLRALHRDQQFHLTADQRVMYCEQVVADQPVRDNNNRWLRVTTYRTRLNPPSM